MCALQGAGETWTYFLEGPYLCAGIRTDCGDADKARLRGPFHRTRGWGTCSLSFLLSRDLKATTGVNRMNFLPAEDKCDYLTTEETLINKETKQVSGTDCDIRG